VNLVDSACSSPSKFEQGNGQFPVCGWLSIKHSHLEGFRIAMFACERVSRCMPKHCKARCQVTNGSIAKASAVDNQRRQEEAWGKGVLGRARFESDSEWVVYHSTSLWDGHMIWNHLLTRHVPTFGWRMLEENTFRVLYFQMCLKSINATPIS
jgi:hypothetical protein